MVKVEHLLFLLAFEFDTFASRRGRLADMSTSVFDMYVTRTLLITKTVFDFIPLFFSYSTLLLFRSSTLPHFITHPTYVEKGKDL